MNGILDKLNLLKSLKVFGNVSESDLYEKQINVLYGILGNIYGVKKMVQIAGDKNVLQELQSTNIKEKTYSLLVIVSNENEKVSKIETDEDLKNAIEKLEDKTAEMISIKTIESEINKKVNKLMEERHNEYIKELKKRVISDETGPENDVTERKYKELEKLDQKKELKTIMEILRPNSFTEVVGQEKSIKALITKLGTPYPQHVILYGPPGVGKTTAARLVLEEVKRLAYTPFEEEAPFIEVDGTTLRWDPRDISNPLTGSVHDPIYQGAQKDFAGDGIPEPKLGLVTDAHGGILFIDEIGEMDIKYQSKLLKVLEDKRISFESAYYDSENPKIPKYIKKLFSDGAPADFILIGATTKRPEDINPAIRSRVAEVFFEPLNRENIKKIVSNAAHKLEIDIEKDAVELISEYTIEGRKAVNILADVYSSKLYEECKNENENNKKNIVITTDDVIKVIKINRLNTVIKKKSSNKKEVGKVFGLGVSHFMGSIIELEGIKFETEIGKGNVRFNDTAGSMAKDSVFNAISVARNYTGIDVKDIDIHINIIGGGNVDGPSAGAAITALIISILQDKPLRQDVALTGEISIRGDIRPVGGVVEKIYGAVQGGIKKVLVPFDNRNDVPEELEDVEVVIVNTIEDVMKELI